MLGLIAEALNEAERQAAESNPESEKQPNEEAGVNPCETQADSGGSQPPEEGDPGMLGEEKSA